MLLDRERSPPAFSSSVTRLTTKRARWSSATKSCTLAGSNCGSSIFQGRNLLLMPRTESDSPFLDQQNPLLLRQAPRALETTVEADCRCVGVEIVIRRAGSAGSCAQFGARRLPDGEPAL